MSELSISDPMAAPTYAPTWFQKRLEAMVRDPRDVVFVRLTLVAVAVMTAAHALVWWKFHWVTVGLFLAAYVKLLPSVILMLHNTMHRPFFVRRKWADKVHNYVFTVLMGIPAGYMEHHVGMHHVENNLEEDLSATLRYQRDNALHFLAYFFRFFFLIFFELPIYMARKKRTHMAVRAISAELVMLGVISGALWLDWRKALVTLAGPYLFVRLMMMLGNWGQHAFIDAKAPGDSLVNSITCINSPYNHKAFNDGYHIGHHVKQNRHWTEMPADFLAQREVYAKAGCIVFERLDFFLVSLLLLSRQYGFLAKRMVHLGGPEKTLEEKKAFLRSRTQPIIRDEAARGIATA